MSVKKKSSRKKKDPDAPKRPLSGYMYFSNEYREVVRSENPSINFGQVSKILAEKWKNLGLDDRKPYEEMADNDKKRYQKEKDVYSKKES